MLKNLIVLFDDTEISSGTTGKYAIKSITITECVNSGEELTLGSTCSNMIEATVFTPDGSCPFEANYDFSLYKVDEAGNVVDKVGIFCPEKPTRVSPWLVKLVAYDNISCLDKDLTNWLAGLDGWPYSLLTFAKMVSYACGLELSAEDIPNADLLVTQFAREATGRQLMQWIGEACCRFCRSKYGGRLIEFGWYTPSGISIAPSGDNYYFQRGLSYEDYRVAPIEGVQLKLTSDDGSTYLWPEVPTGANTYIISDNPILNQATDTIAAALHNIAAELAGVTYTPCKVSIPATADIHAGNTVEITDVSGKTFTAYVMTKVQRGQKDVLECTGSPRRDKLYRQSSARAALMAMKNSGDGTSTLIGT